MVTDNNIKGAMKLQTQFTVHKKDLQDLDYDRKTETLKKVI